MVICGHWSSLRGMAVPLLRNEDLRIVGDRDLSGADDGNTIYDRGGNLRFKG